MVVSSALYKARQTKLLAVVSCPRPHASATPTYYFIVQLSLFVLLLLINFALSAYVHVDSCLNTAKIVHFWVVAHTVFTVDKEMSHSICSEK